ncbi:MULTISPECIES: hypothetical protein [Pectobacterium]|uniref:hypothetical protein n=1 Tax=Pectobacterium TaxID=122277 RepID=UPI0018DAB13C|nr:MULTISPECIES: hypothetical protein [Pectobacterium]QPI42797.1 hypothetical protein I2D83_20670 [Pectobacterium aroidearum]
MTHTLNNIAALLSNVKPIVNHCDSNGWIFTKKNSKKYIPARLTLNESLFGDIDSAKIILISAPGAVGKSVMARELSNQTGAIYLDLSQASTIAGNYLIGGLANKDILNEWNEGTAGLVIDSLDEARLRVTQNSFEDFLEDVNSVSKRNANPIIIFGRVGIIEETWLILSDVHGIDCPVFDIEFFNECEASLFILESIKGLSERYFSNNDYKHLPAALRDHYPVYEKSVSEIVASLREVSGNESTRFFGYAPVLDAVSKVVGTISNPSRISDEMASILSGELLLNICKAILSREQGKLTTQLSEKFESFKDNLYTADEQLNKLSCHILNIEPIPIHSVLTSDLVSVYDDAVNSMLPQHPFLDGAGRKCASSVFEACVLAHALQSGKSNIAKAARNYCLSGRITPNPFLFDFFVEALPEEGSSKISSEYVGLLFDSALSKLKNSDNATLIVNDNDDFSLNIEFILNEDDVFKEIEFSSDGYGVLLLGSKVGNVFVNTDSSDVEFSSSDQLELFSPVSISCDNLIIHSERIIVKSVKSDAANTNVILEAKNFKSDKPVNVPIVRPGSELYVSWPSSEAYPWSAFSSKFSDDESSGRVADTLRVFRRIVMAFRSHSKGRLARLQDKINHVRMLRDVDGRALLAKLISDGVISAESHMYYLEPNKLGSVTGASFLDVNKKNYSADTMQYIKQAINFSE